MPRKQVTDPITDQETTFARLVLSGTMTDREAAEAAGLKPASAAYYKAKPGVRAYMQQHRAAVEQQLVDKDADQLRRLQETRDRLLARLWEIAALDPKDTRGSASSQVKALSLIAAIEGLLPKRSTISSAAKPDENSVAAQFYKAAWMREREEAQQNQDANPAQAAEKPQAASQPPPAAEPADPPPSMPEAAPASPAPAGSPMARVPGAEFLAPDTRRPFSIPRRFGPPGLNRGR